MKILQLILAITLVGTTANLSASVTLLARESGGPGTEICHLDATKLTATDNPTTITPVVITSDLTDADLANADLTDASFEIDPAIMPQFCQEPSLTDKIKWAFAFLRMKANIACDTTGTAVSNGYDKVTIHLSKHKKVYIVGTVCVGGVLVGILCFNKK